MIADVHGDLTGEAARGSVLYEALAVINGERQDQYGDPENSFVLIAEYWNAFLGQRCEQPRPKYGSQADDVDYMPVLRPQDVAVMMALFKIAREGHAHKRDNLVDAAGYLGLAGDIEAV